MEHLESRLMQLNNNLLKLAEHRALLHNGRYSVSDIPNNNIIDILKNNNVRNRAYSNGFQDIKNIETIPVEPDTIEEAELDIIEEIIPQEEVELISSTESSEVYTYKHKTILVSEDYTATIDDYYIGIKSEDSVTITIPCDCDDGHEIVVKSEMKQPLNDIKITIISMDDENLCSIDGELEYIMDLPYQSVRFICRDNNWWTI